MGSLEMTPVHDGQCRMLSCVGLELSAAAVFDVCRQTGYVKDAESFAGQKLIEKIFVIRMCP